MKKKIFLAASFIVGISLFLVAFFGSGINNILNVFSKISMKYLGLFFLVSLLILFGKPLCFVEAKSSASPLSIDLATLATFPLAGFSPF